MKNRLSINDIEAVIFKEEYLVQGEYTICILELKNGYKVSGTSSCVDPKNFDAELGKKLSREAARNKIWPLEGYLLKQRMYEGKVTSI